MSIRPRGGRGGRRRRRATLLLGAVATGALSVTPVYADTIGTGPNGQRLTVSKTAAVSRTGETVTVSGTGYNTGKGIYVAFCVDNGPGALPTPCGGGADTSGSSGASQWISSNPPSYGEGLAIPYGPGGSFRVQIRLSPTIGDTDCTVRRCVVATRNDHTRGSDRTQDVLVPVTFTAQNQPSRRPATATPSRTPATTARSTTARTPGADTSVAPGAPATGGASGIAATGAGAAPGTEPVAAGSIEVTRVSESSPTGRWWMVALGLLAAALVGVLLLRARNRRGAA
ncbi:hypothetical protein ACI2K4_01000 [Micromonospora sp. NPDC050397]|uniref:hypothetical protein n=1 Tax=Micromonospora sp. NPDC050397 TaxID=3364279 RepID=UPI00384D1EE4